MSMLANGGKTGALELICSFVQMQYGKFGSIIFIVFCILQRNKTLGNTLHLFMSVSPFINGHKNTDLFCKDS